MVVEIGAALAGRVFRLGGGEIEGDCAPGGQQVPHQRTTLVRNDKRLVSDGRSHPSASSAIFISFCVAQGATGVRRVSGWSLGAWLEAAGHSLRVRQGRLSADFWSPI